MNVRDDSSMSYRVQGSGSLKAADCEDQLGLEEKGGRKTLMAPEQYPVHQLSGTRSGPCPLRSLRFEARGTLDSPRHSNHWRVQYKHCVSVFLF